MGKISTTWLTASVSVVLLTLAVTVRAQAATSAGPVEFGAREGLADSFSAARPQIFVVDCAAGQSLQAALDGAVAGDSLSVFGACKENIVIRKDAISLACQAGSLITGTIGVTLEVRGHDIRVSGCAVAGGAFGIAVLGGGSVALSKNDVSDALVGIAVGHRSYARLDGNRIERNGMGVVITLGAAADIIGNEITANRTTSVLVTGAGAAEMVGNRIKGNGGDGVSTTRTSAVKFSGHEFFGSAPNEISGNGGDGIGCFSDGAVRFGVAQEFAQGNGGRNFRVDTKGACAVIGSPT